MGKPFIVYGLPRSRTFWLSRLLNYGDYACFHERSMYMRSVEDLKSWLAQDFTGTAETAAAPAWRLIHHFRPDVSGVVVRRPVEEALESLLRIDLSGVGSYQRDSLETTLRYLDRCLDQISALPGVLSVNFADLGREDVCARVFTHCLPYAWDKEWYGLHDVNLQHNVRAMLRYRFAHRPQIHAFKRACWSELRRLREEGALS